MLEVGNGLLVVPVGLDDHALDGGTANSPDAATEVLHLDGILAASSLLAEDLVTDRTLLYLAVGTKTRNEISDSAFKRIDARARHGGDGKEGVTVRRDATA